MSASGVSATEHMDRIYRYQRYIYDITRKFYLLGRDRILDDLRPPDGARVLEVGCGTGRNLIQAAKRFPDAKFFGFDVSTTMLETAERSVTRAKLGDTIVLAHGDATNFDSQSVFGVPAFERVYVSYALSMIPPWKEAAQRAMELVAPGGSLHVVDFGQQDRLPGWFKAILFAWLRLFDVFPNAELEGELERLADANGAELKFERLYGGYTYVATLTRPQGS